MRYAKRVVQAFRSSIKRLNLSCPLFLTQNDGTLLDSTTAAQVPIKTFSSGATNSMRGAAYLSRHKPGSASAIVVDIGGTTTDVGFLLPSGFPRQASSYNSIAGVNVNYSLPQLHSISLGGGSIVKASNGQVSIGPTSVGHSFTKDALIFGGETVTVSDIAVAAGNVDIGDRSLVEGLDGDVVAEAQQKIKSLLERALEHVKTSPEDTLVLLVGGGKIVAPKALKGASSIVVPVFHSVANAVGAACAQVPGTVDELQGLKNSSLKQLTHDACALAQLRAVKAGAIEKSITITEISTMPVPYLADQIRIVVKAVGDLDMLSPTILTIEDVYENIEEDAVLEEGVKQVNKLEREVDLVDHDSYIPTIISNESGRPEWVLSFVDLDYIADGCYVLGCGGGGSPYPGKLQLRELINSGHRIRCIDHSNLADNAKIYWGGRMGSPAAISERLQAHEVVSAIEELMEYLGHDSFDAVMGLEIGGSNGLEPFLWGSDKFHDRPVLDGDFMGRAYPCCWQNTLSVNCPGELAPCAVDSGDGQTIIMTRSSSDLTVDKVLRGAITEMGSLAGLACKPTTGLLARKHAVLNTISLSWRIGRAIARARAHGTMSTVVEDMIVEAGGDQSAKILFRGKITSVENRLHKGHSIGVLNITHHPNAVEPELDKRRKIAVANDGNVEIPFKNENILVRHIAENGQATIIASVPDTIAVIDEESGKALGIPDYKYGCHVVVLGITCSPRWSENERALQIGGPRGFDYEFDYVPLGSYIAPRSVILEYAGQSVEMSV